MTPGDYVIVRSSPSGCWAGTLHTINDRTVSLTDARRLYRWWAAEGVSLSGVAVAGLHPEHLDECLIAAPVATAMIMDVCEVLSVTESARRCIVEHPARVST
jgi:hypothetical protein